MCVLCYSHLVQPSRFLDPGQSRLRRDSSLLVDVGSGDVSDGGIGDMRDRSTEDQSIMQNERRDLSLSTYSASL